MTVTDNLPNHPVVNEIKLLTDVLEESLQLLNPTKDAGFQEPVTTKAVQHSLFEQCIELCRQGRIDISEPIRTIHHLSCSGGTLITKCLAAMPNVQVLNEVDPLSPLGFNPKKPSFSPTDILSLLKQGNQNAPEELLIKIFLESLAILHDEMRMIGKHLLLRDHSHSHFLTGRNIARRPDLLSLVRDRFKTLSIVTVRDPVDSYLSIQHNGWLHFEPATFDEYCRRYNAFLDIYSDSPFFRYEDFVSEPSSVAYKMCEILELKYSEFFTDTFDAFVFSGDSGREGNVIKPRQRRVIEKKNIQEARESKDYLQLIKRLGYQASYEYLGVDE